MPYTCKRIFTSLNIYKWKVGHRVVSEPGILTVTFLNSRTMLTVAFSFFFSFNHFKREEQFYDCAKLCDRSQLGSKGTDQPLTKPHSGSNKHHSSGSLVVQNNVSSNRLNGSLLTASGQFQVSLANFLVRLLWSCEECNHRMD